MDNKQEFKWTDTLKVECLDYLMQQFISKEWAGFSSEVEEFKKSKEHKVEEKRIEVIHFSYGTSNLVETEFAHHFITSKEIPLSKKDAIIKAIEQVLNNEPLSDSIPTLERQEGKCDCKVGEPYNSLCCPVHGNLPPFTPKTTPQESKQDSKGWEIQCIVLDSKNYWIQKDGLYKSDLFGSHLHSSWLLSNGGIIHSVKRLSDGEVFSVGLNNNGKIIEKFFEGWNGMEIHYTDGSASLLLEETKLPLTEQPKPRQMWNKHTGIHDESVLCTGMKCQEYNPLNIEHHP